MEIYRVLSRYSPPCTRLLVVASRVVTKNLTYGRAAYLRPGPPYVNLHLRIIYIFDIFFEGGVSS